MSASKKIITLKSSDGEVFDVEEAVAMESQTIKHLIEDDCANDDIPLLKVTNQILAKVIKYCRKHVEFAAAAAAGDNKDNNKVSSSDESLKVWDDNFVKVDQNTLFNLIMAANYLNINNLLDLTVADMMKRKATEEICKILNIKNDYTLPGRKKRGLQRHSMVIRMNEL